MPVTIKTTHTVDFAISQIDFIDSPNYAIEIYPAEEVDISSVRKPIQVLAVALGMGGTYCEFEIDYNVEDKVRITGNISQAIHEIKENIPPILIYSNDEKDHQQIQIFSKELLEEIDNHKQVQSILKNCKARYEHLNKANEGSEPLSKPSSSLNNPFVKFQPFEESKESRTKVPNVQQGTILKKIPGQTN